ncbi:hypothetical protein DY000_02054039 [Brassica cretica]|uniref:Pentatricopeptide repeat-containing protein n=1 Tax=Brassica cretica TaxID=69181 RepID=A0ABQ7AFL3_BRACR|nr:hypothetical protein DY000_02054039 [Brassica cretica]
MGIKCLIKFPPVTRLCGPTSLISRYGYHGQVSEVLKFFEKMKKVEGDSTLDSDRMRSDATRDCRGCHGRSQTVKAATPLRKVMEYETLSTMLLTEKPFKAPSTSSATFFVSL